MMELMQTYDKNDGVVGVDDLDRWPVDSDAFGFLSTVSSTVSIEVLEQVRQFSAGFSFLGSLGTVLTTLNSTHSSANRIDIVVSLCAWLDAPQSPRGPSIHSKLDAFDDNLLLISFYLSYVVLFSTKGTCAMRLRLAWKSVKVFICNSENFPVT